MRALVHDPGAPQGLALGDVPDPQPRASEALIGVAATSLTFADVAFLPDRGVPGAVVEVTGGETLVDALDATP